MSDEQPLRILVAEDDAMVREVITVFLGEDRHTVVTARDGREAFEKFQAGEFDIVLTDRVMPGMNGDQLAAAIKQLRAATPVILLTGYGDMMQGAGEKPGGVDFILSKPFTVGSLRGAIAAALGR